MLAVTPMGTPFQRMVWTALRRISRRQTVSYSELAARIGKHSAVRAVGAANGENPIPVVVPCHRVIGADGSLVGYGGGIEQQALVAQARGRVTDLGARGGARARGRGVRRGCFLGASVALRRSGRRRG
jgi:methylated-DNA-[protein]-cysteine S-methyltransferase